MCAWIPLALLAPLVLGETNFLDRIVWPRFSLVGAYHIPPSGSNHSGRHSVSGSRVGPASVYLAADLKRESTRWSEDSQRDFNKRIADGGDSPGALSSDWSTISAATETRFQIRFSLPASASGTIVATIRRTEFVGSGLGTWTNTRKPYKREILSGRRLSIMMNIGRTAHAEIWSKLARERRIEPLRK